MSVFSIIPSHKSVNPDNFPTIATAQILINLSKKKIKILWCLTGKILLDERAIHLW